MTQFKDFLKDSESIFLNPIVLDYDYQPKLVPYRENFQKYIASCIKPLFQNRTGKNLFLFGPTGVGKTVSSKHVLKELEDYDESVYLVYINCWKFDTSFKIINEICNQIGYKFVHNKRTDELISIVTSYLNKKSAVIAFDEVDKLKDFDALYNLLEEIYRKTILLISNNKEWLVSLDRRLKSRLNLEEIEFKKYTKEEISGILNQRLDLAFVPNSFDKDAFEPITEICHKIGDIRTGLFLIKESGELAELNSSKKVTINHAMEAIDKFKLSVSFNTSDIGQEEKNILNLIKENSGKKLKEIFMIYKKMGGNISYTTFHRRINELKKDKFIETEEITTDGGGKSYIVKYAKKLEDF